MEIDKNLIIIRTDGGISSQIAFYSLGRYLEDKGYKVKYDITWFKEYSKDCNGVFARNYDINKAFPNLKIEIANEEEIKYYSENYPLITSDIKEFKAPLYINGYPERLSSVLKYKNFLRENFLPVDISSCSNLLNTIKKCNSCAIHVRLGDLAKYTKEYGFPADAEYYIKAISIISALQKNVKFFFFSEEPNWIKENIIPKLDNVDYEICDQNGSDKGYLDLYLMTYCKHIIGSKGSFGYFAKILSQNPDGYFICLNDNLKIGRKLENTIIICKDEPEENFISHVINNKQDLQNNTFIENIFSIKNKYINNVKRKVITILGFKIKLKLKDNPQTLVAVERERERESNTSNP